MHPTPIRSEPDAERAAIDREKARRHLGDFVRQAWPIIEPGTRFVDNWHIDAVCQHLEAVANGQIQKLVINIPPGTAKSTMASVCFPAWSWISNPSYRSLFSSHSQTFAVRDSVATRKIVESEWYRASFSDPAGWELADDDNQKTRFATTMGGFREIIPRYGGTGAHGDVVLVDDPLSQMEGMSKLERDKVNDWWSKTIPTRVNDLATSAFVIVMQRLHREDLSGFVEGLGTYTFLRLPHHYKPARRCVTVIADREFWGDPRTEDRELLFPKKFPEEALVELAATLRSDAPGQLEQDPEAEGGNILKREHWRFWRADGAPPAIRRPDGCSSAPARLLPAKFEQIVITIDAAFKDKPGGSRVGMLALGVLGADRFLLGRATAHMDHLAMKKALAGARAEDPKAPIGGFIARIESTFAQRVSRIFIEDKANGPAVVSDLKAKIGRLIPVSPEGGKEARLNVCSGEIESGNVYIPEGEPWTDEFVGECAAFPRGEYDDDVDALTQGLTAIAAGTALGTFMAQAT